MRKIVIALSVVAIGCGGTPQTAVAPQAAPIQASREKTWNAVIDVLAERNISVKTLDKASGFVSAEGAVVSSSDIAQLTTCGGFMEAMADMNGAHNGVARYNILVRGDSAASSVKVTAQFTKGTGGGNAKNCDSNGKFEAGLQSAIKSHAEGA